MMDLDSPPGAQEETNVETAPAPTPPPPAVAAPVMEAKTRIEVCVRVRPENAFEQSQSRHRNIIQVQDNVIFIDPDPGNRTIPGSKRRRKLEYGFDTVFGPNTSQQEVFDGTVKELIPSLFAGYNSSVFCYGATGAGKTHTMMGDELSMPGVIPLAVAGLFKQAELEQGARHVQLSLAYCEIYNETIRDLLAEKQKPLDFRVGESGGQVAGLTWWEPGSAVEVLRLVSIGNSKRVKAETNVNEASSRSHAILQLVVKTKPLGAEINSVSQIGKLSLIDLAGSERAAATENRGMRLKEGANINKSLLALGNVINSLAAKKRKATFIGYRDSKLTRMLQDSLGGNCRTLMIANISPSFLTYEDTHNTLKYSNRAQSIQVTLKKNTTVISAHISKYKSIIESLQGQVSSLQDQLMLSQSQSQKFRVIAEERRDTAASDVAQQGEQRLKGLSEALLTLLGRISEHETKRNESLLQLRLGHAEILRWKHTASGNGQEPVRIVTLKADIVMLQSQVAVADCELQTAKADYQVAIRQLSDFTATLPLQNAADQKFLGGLLREHQLRMDKAQSESYVQYHKSREQHWEQRFHELEQTWNEMTCRLSDTLKRGGTADDVKATLSVGRKWKLLSEAVDASSVDNLLQEEVHTEAMEVDDSLVPLADSSSPQYPERPSFGLGLNYLERPKRPTVSQRPDISNNVTESKPARIASGSGNGGGSGSGDRPAPRRVPSYMKATNSSVRFKKEKRTAAPPPPPMDANDVATEPPRCKGVPRTPNASGSSPSFLKPTRSAVARAHTKRVEGPPAEMPNDPRTNLLEERRRQRKLAQVEGGGGGGGGGSSAATTPAEVHPLQQQQVNTIHTTLPQQGLKHPLGVSASQVYDFFFVLS